MNRLDEIWLDLERTHEQTGYATRLFSNLTSIEIVLGMKYPERNRFLGLRIPSKLAEGYRSNLQLKGLRIDRIEDNLDPKMNLINLVLTEDSYSDVFDNVISDILMFLEKCPDDGLALKNFNERIKKWQRFFEGKPNQGLSPEEQQGLYGELFMLRLLLNENVEPLRALESWVGGLKRPRDFQYKSWGIEVKTSLGSGPFKIKINGERQLDTKAFDDLYLFHIVLEKMVEAGESLPEIISELETKLGQNSIAYQEFTKKLNDWKYEENDIPLYSKIRYSIRITTIYKVADNFPRIEESDLRPGVGEVDYYINISGCSSYVSNLSDFVSRLRAND